MAARALHRRVMPNPCLLLLMVCLEVLLVVPLLVLRFQAVVFGYLVAILLALSPPPWRHWLGLRR